MLYAASAFAANVIVRSLVAAAFPLFTNQMYHNVRRRLQMRFHIRLLKRLPQLGLNWGSTLIGCISLVLAPMPFLFYKFGPAIRSRSKFSPSSVSVLLPFTRTRKLTISCRVQISYKTLRLRRKRPPSTTPPEMDTFNYLYDSRQSLL